MLVLFIPYLNVEHVSSSKCNVQNENFAFLWHQRLGHVSKNDDEVGEK